MKVGSAYATVWMLGLNDAKEKESSYGLHTSARTEVVTWDMQLQTNSPAPSRNNRSASLYCSKVASEHSFVLLWKYGPFLLSYMN